MTPSWYLLLAGFIFTILRLPSIFEPYWYGDEAIYQVLGWGMRHKRLLYRDVWDNKPPLLYSLYAIFNSDQFLIRLASLIFGLLSVVVFFFLAKKIFKSKMAVFLSTLLYSFIFATPYLEGNIANAENFMLFPVLGSALLLLNYEKKSDKKLLFISGTLLSLAFLFKAVAIFDAASFFIYLIFITYKSKDTLFSEIKKLLPFAVSFIIPIAITSLFFIFKGAFWDFFNAAFKQTAGYVSSTNTFIIPQGLLILKLFILLIISSYLFVKRNVFTHSHIFIFLWLAFSLFSAFFAQRPYTHYLLVLLPSFALLFGLFLEERQLRFRLAWGVLIILIYLIIRNNFNLYGKNFAYYSNFLSFITNKKDITAYRAFFDRRTPNDYAISEYLSMHAKKDDTIFVWGDNAEVYVLSQKLPPGRYSVAYHITASKATLLETKSALEKSPPNYIIVTTPTNPYPFSLSNYRYKYTIGESTLYERVL